MEEGWQISVCDQIKDAANAHISQFGVSVSLGFNDEIIVNMDPIERGPLPGGAEQFDQLMSCFREQNPGLLYQRIGPGWHRIATK